MVRELIYDINTDIFDTSSRPSIYSVFIDDAIIFVRDVYVLSNHHLQLYDSKYCRLKNHTT